MQPAPGPAAAPVSLSVANRLPRQRLAQGGLGLPSNSSPNTGEPIVSLPVATLPVTRAPVAPTTRPIPTLTLPVVVLVLIWAFRLFPAKLMPAMLLLATLSTTRQPGQSCSPTPARPLPDAVTPLMLRPEALWTAMPVPQKPVTVPPAILTPVRGGFEPAGSTRMPIGIALPVLLQRTTLLSGSGVVGTSRHQGGDEFTEEGPTPA